MGDLLYNSELRRALLVHGGSRGGDFPFSFSLGDRLVRPAREGRDSFAPRNRLDEPVGHPLRKKHWCVNRVGAEGDRYWKAVARLSYRDRFPRRRSYYAK